MQPFSRETIVDRRQPALRWTAVLAGSAVAIATWMLLQLFGTGIALSLLESRDWNRIHQIGIGSSAWSVIALIIALFVGGMLAGRLSGHHDRKVVGLHGLLVWAITAIVGVIAVASSISMMTPSVVLSRDLALHGAEVRGNVLAAASTTGCAMLIASLSLLLGAVGAVAGAMTAAHNVVRHRRHDTLPGTTLPPHHTTAPYPIQTENPPNPGTD